MNGVVAREASSYPELSRRVEIVPQAPLQAIVCERFGIEPAFFQDKVFIQSNRGLVSLLNGDHDVPAHSGYQASGIPFAHTKMAFPKLTTSAVFLIGRHVTKNVIQLDRTQADLFLARSVLQVSGAQLKDCTGRGHVVVRYGRVPLGLGMLRPHSGAEENLSSGDLESYFPKAWSVEGGMTTFG